MFGPRRCRWPIGAALALFVFVHAPALSAEQVDLELVIATDVSRSVNTEEALLQREGVAQAFRSAELIAAIERGALGKIAVTYVDWSTEYINRVVVNWQIVQDRATATGFAAALMEAPPTWGQRTSISSVLIFATALIESNEFEGTRRVIDISGDGPNNFGRPLAPVRDEVLAKGVVINGLPIIVAGAEFAGRGYFPDVDEYYQSCVIGGFGSFIVVAKGFDDFAAAMRRKLVLEISELMPEDPVDGRPVILRAAATPGGSEALPTLPQGSPLFRAPPAREQDCDRWSDGFGSFNDFRRR